VAAAAVVVKMGRWMLERVEIPTSAVVAVVVAPIRGMVERVEHR